MRGLNLILFAAAAILAITSTGSPAAPQQLFAGITKGKAIKADAAYRRGRAGGIAYRGRGGVHGGRAFVAGRRGVYGGVYRRGGVYAGRTGYRGGVYVGSPYYYSGGYYGGGVYGRRGAYIGRRGVYGGRAFIAGGRRGGFAAGGRRYAGGRAGGMRRR